MAHFSKKLCEDRVALWLEAEEAIATGQSYQIGTRMLTRANLNAVREELEWWSDRLAEAEAEEEGLARGRNRVYRAVPRDL